MTDAHLPAPRRDGLGPPNNHELDRPETRELVLNELRATGRKNQSARAAGLCPQTVRTYLDLSEAFAAEYQVALDDYKDSIRAEVHRRGVEGWLEPVYQKGVRVLEPVLDEEGRVCRDAEGHIMYTPASIRKFSDRLLELEAKRVDPEYRDRRQVDHTVKGGVMVAPEEQTPEDWVAEQARLNDERRPPEGVGGPPVIDGEATEITDS